MDSSSIAHDLRAEEWRQIVLEANNSGQPKIQYIREHHLSENSFYYWQRLFRKEAIAQSEGAGLPAAASPVPTTADKPASVGPQNSAFIEVTAPSSPLSSDEEERHKSAVDPSSWDVLLQHGDYSLYLNNTVSEKCLKTVLRAISHA